jgi:acetyl esterase/lipase
MSRTTFLGASCTLSSSAIRSPGIPAWRLALGGLLLALPLAGSARPALGLEGQIASERDVLYGEAGGAPLKLDIHRPLDRPSPRPVLLFIHGGGWLSGSKADAIPELPPAQDVRRAGRRTFSMLPYLRLGAAVVSVEYRLSQVAPAPAAVEDCLRALRWVTRHGAEHGLDPKRLAVIGPSAGGHLALMVALARDEARFATPRELRDVRPRVAGAVDVYGITDVLDVLEGKNSRDWAQRWVPEGPGRAERARRVSPLTHVRAGAPPILIIHDEEDDIVPYEHSVRLRDALGRVGAKVELITVPGMGHGRFSAEALTTVEQKITAFLEKVGVLERP